MPLKPHPTDPNKMVFESNKYEFDPNAWREHASEYERGFIDGMQKQMHSSVDKSVNAMNKREWVGLTDKEYKAIRFGDDDNGDPLVDYELFDEGEYGMEINIYIDRFAKAFEKALKDKNT